MQLRYFSFPNTLGEKKVGLFILAFWKSMWKYKLQNKILKTVEELFQVWIIFYIIKVF